MIRNWVKLWVNEWLDGTTRYQMSGAQRAFWVDLLAMAGRSRTPGIICAGQDEGRFVGYPLTVFSALDAGSEIDILSTWELFERTGKIRVEATNEIPLKLYKISILNWDKYQSEYSRQRGYRKGFREGYKRGPKKVTPQVTTEVTTKNTPELQPKLQPTLHREGEGDKHHCANENGLHGPVSPFLEPDEPSSEDEALARIWNYYLEKTAKNPKLYEFTPLRKQKGRARLGDCLRKATGNLAKAEDLMTIAIDNLTASAWHMGENPGKKRYDSWERNLFKSTEQLEDWLNQVSEAAS